MNCVQVSPEPVQVMIPINCCLIGRTLQVTLAVARWVQTLSTPITQVHRLKVCLIVECLIEMKVFLRVFAVFGLCVCVFSLGASYEMWFSAKSNWFCFSDAPPLSCILCCASGLLLLALSSCGWTFR